MKKLLLFVLGISFFLVQYPLLIAQEQQTKADSDKEITKVIEDFWSALGTLDVEALKQTFDWPVSIVESSATETKNPRVLMLPKDLDADFNKQRPKSGHSEFYGTKLSDFKVEMQNPTLALVTYTATLPATTDPHKPASFNAIAIVRKSPLWHSWKIIFLTVPK